MTDCVGTTSALQAVDSSIPFEGEGFYYLLAGRSCCGAIGGLGADSNGAPRPPGLSCP